MLGFDAGHSGESHLRECSAQDCRVLKHRPGVGRKTIEPGANDRAHGVRHAEGRQIAARHAANAVVFHQIAVGDHHADQLDGVQRDPVGAIDDGRRKGVVTPLHHADDESAHLLVGQGTEMRGGEVASPCSPARNPIEEIGTSQREYEDRMTR